MSDTDRRTRRERVKADHGKEWYPDCADRRLIDYLMDAGPVMSGASGPIALSASELRAWADGRSIKLRWWEFQAILDGSKSYLSGYYSDSAHPPQGGVAISQQELEARLLNALRQVGKK